MAGRRIAMAAAAALVLLLAACGGSGDAASNETVARDAASVSAAVAASLLLEDGTGPFDSGSAVCAASGLISAVGLDRTAEAVDAAGDAAVGEPAALFAQLSAEETAAALGAVVPCVEMGSAVPATMLAFGFPEAVSSCVGAALVADGFGRSIISAFLAGSDPTQDEGFAASYIGALSGECTPATRQLLADDLVSYGVGAASAACVADAFVGAGNYADLVAVWMGAEDESVDVDAVNTQMSGIFTSCLTADELALLGIETTTTTAP